MERKSQPIGDGVALSYLDGGEGPVLLLIHGFTGTATTDMGLLIDEFQGNYRIIAPDLRGYGASRPPNRDFPPDFYQRDAADVATLLDQIGCGPVIVLGFSDGAEVSLLLAAARPDLVRGVCSWGVCGVISDEELGAVKGWLPISNWGPEREAWRQRIIERHGEEQLASMVEGWVSAAQAIHAAGGNISLATADQIECPVILLNGDGEVGNTPEDFRRLAERIPNCRYEFVSHCGHAIQDDQPEILLDRIRQLLNAEPY
ncbi:MAG: alpha/beta hydrolase [Anaerolineae bacterium]|nr:alpha/beta hydrolase [Anaerolineae bacterium]